MVIKRMINNISWFYWQFQLVTMTYLMDSFEWWVFHGFLLVTSLLLAYIFYAVLGHVRHLFDLQPESTISAMM